ncbi:MAG: hypothetical protein MZU97_06080 [Bacillus subtilis]|nr:hypothetical protein [Bacillus subtilis]
MKKRTIVKRILIAVVILFILITSTMIVMITGPIEMTLNQRSFETVSFETIEKVPFKTMVRGGDTTKRKSPCWAM